MDDAFSGRTTTLEVSRHRCGHGSFFQYTEGRVELQHRASPGSDLVRDVRPFYVRMKRQMPRVSRFLQAKERRIVRHKSGVRHVKAVHVNLVEPGIAREKETVVGRNNHRVTVVLRLTGRRSARAPASLLRKPAACPKPPVIADGE